MTTKANMTKVMNNKDLLTNVLSYLDNKEITSLLSVGGLRPNVHYDYIVPQHNMLLYGQVQSGKTKKTIDYIKNYKKEFIKIIIIQNSVSMLKQYEQVLRNNLLKYKILDRQTAKTRYKQEQVIITIHNKYRMIMLTDYLKENKININKCCMILDESDQYLDKIKNEEIFKKVKNILHVTATPFKYVRKFKPDKVITIKASSEYIGIDKVNMIPVIMPEQIDMQEISVEIKKILTEKFFIKEHGFMLINCFTRINQMINTATDLSLRYSNIPFIVLSTNTHIIINGETRIVKTKNIQQLIDNFNNDRHIVIIANRLSNRGINYTNNDYSRHISDQISFGKGTYANFIQKCRIFGIHRNEIQEDNKPTIYCLSRQYEEFYIDKLKKRINYINKKLTEVEVPKPIKEKKITVKQLKILCRANQVRGFSKLKRIELIELLTRHNINMDVRQFEQPVVEEA
jgi:PHD/YefM family antitoxin component YafN of YafNO toxin-antitoxin module